MSKRNKIKVNRFWPCKRCGECCINIPIELDLVNQMRDRFQRNIVKETISPNKVRGSMYVKINTSDGKCVFLDQDNNCVIYQNRPKICRDFGLKPGILECIHVTPSGRIRTPQESDKAKKKISRLNKKMAEITGDYDEKIFGVHYTYDD